MARTLRSSRGLDDASEYDVLLRVAANKGLLERNDLATEEVMEGNQVAKP